MLSAAEATRDDEIWLEMPLRVMYGQKCSYLLPALRGCRGGEKTNTLSRGVSKGSPGSKMTADAAEVVGHEKGRRLLDEKRLG